MTKAKKRTTVGMTSVRLFCQIQVSFDSIVDVSNMPRNYYFVCENCFNADSEKNGSRAYIVASNQNWSRKNREIVDKCNTRVMEADQVMLTTYQSLQQVYENAERVNNDLEMMNEKYDELNCKYQQALIDATKLTSTTSNDQGIVYLASRERLNLLYALSKLEYRLI